ncbi:hypothetical protein ASG43_06260 [Aureimonas sp. Leaf454]|uniref:AbrB/MazE/SpoVT family DNA-binding domain-containing protein n=1 Tax=Aureimonas sp. Leaf454 TaxID=1736381 RepID=UPI0007124B3D|nr:AbrB/MazE/SpoVT family DNA-binding domain-containing protein [Aureimonas sp. Leaf454]KQT50861.1 hypothetical protein ASG43_06260 [Aureimonas sp. Leaf454]
MTIRVRLSETGEIAIPKDVRDAHGWGAGTEFDLIESGEGALLRQVVLSPRRPSKEQIEAFLASRPRINRPFPTDNEIERIVLEEAKRRFDATRD